MHLLSTSHAATIPSACLTFRQPPPAMSVLFWYRHRHTWNRHDIAIINRAAILSYYWNIITAWTAFHERILLFWPCQIIDGLDRLTGSNSPDINHSLSAIPQMTACLTFRQQSGDTGERTNQWRMYVSTRHKSQPQPLPSRLSIVPMHQSGLPSRLA